MTQIGDATVSEVSMHFNATDHQQLDALLDGMLQAVVTTEVTPRQAREAITQIILAAVINNEPVVRDWLGPDRLDRWIRLCREAQEGGEER
jgi:hypothetical protein